MKFELTISGLVVIALQSSAGEERPEHPQAIDIIVPDDHHHGPESHRHTCRLNYLPNEVLPVPADMKLPEMTVDPIGTRIASLILQGRALEFKLDGNTTSEYTVKWGPPAVQPAAKSEEDTLNWIPKIGDLGFNDFQVGAAGSLPSGARARITLPPGVLGSRNLIADHITDELIVWKFPAVNIQRVLANEVVFKATAHKVSIVENGQELLSSTLAENDTLKMSLSQETTYVPLDYNNPSKMLAHLSHFNILTEVSDKGFQEPVVADPQERTGKPLCMGVVLVHKGEQ
jgi:hypothetical protein